mmetsp:Transcript_19237/g.26460  ORF Transcript_19237/g.26460 Transcript_19237/m.26460 type:complete len:211 (+) Transcript_19237:160-792(+)
MIVKKQLQMILSNIVKKLTRKRLTFILNCIAVLLFIIASVLFYIFQQEWSFITSLFFVVMTITTVGYGDPVPTGSLGRIFTIGLMIFGIYGLVAVLNSFILNKIDQLRKVIRLHDNTPPREDLLNQTGISKMLCNYSLPKWIKYKLLMSRSIIGMLICVIVCTIYFHETENWDWITSLYFAVQTSTVTLSLSHIIKLCGNFIDILDSWIR